MTSGPEERTLGDRSATAITWLCVVFLSFIAGCYVMYERVFPADLLRRAFQGGAALYSSLTDYSDPLQTDFWQAARGNERGVVLHDPAGAFPGLTLYTSGHAHKAFLIDMEGRVVHEWSLPYSQIWDKNSSVRQPRPDEFIYMEKAYVFPNGDLIGIYTAIGDTPWGYGLVKVDKASNVIWKFLEHVHHDFDIDAEGNIYVLTHEIIDEHLPGFPELPRPRIDDFVVKLSPDGMVLKKMSLTVALAESRMGRRLHFTPAEAQNRSGDYLHANSIQMLSGAVSGIPGSRAGQALISLREISMIALFDIEERRLVWAQSGSWYRQHDVQALANGHLLLFDNEGNPSGEGPSRVIEFDPNSQEILWSFAGTAERPLDSLARSSQNRLPNGNTLVVESLAGRLIEVTPGGDIVWEYVNPVRGGDDHSRIPIIFWVQRVEPDSYFTPEFRQRIGTG